MSTAATTPSAPTTEPDGDQCVELWNVGWKGYSTLLRMRGDHRYPRMTYLDGSVYLVSPSFEHESLERRLDRFVTVVVEELDIPCISAGSTTLRRRSKRGGVEGDETYYLTNLARIRGKKKINLRVDPPPDLAAEIVVTHDADEAVEVWRRFRVPEVWICDRDRLTILLLQANGQYAEAERSLAFPALTAAEVHAWVVRDQDEDDTAWVKALRRWVAEVLVPRHRELTKKDTSGTAQQVE
jgi:Uma2 family endonuclease